MKSIIPIILFFMLFSCTLYNHYSPDIPAGVYSETVIVKSSPTSANIYLDSIYIGKTPIKVKLWHDQTRNLNLWAVPIYPNQYIQKLNLYIPPIPDQIMILMNYKAERETDYSSKKKNAPDSIRFVEREVFSEIPVILPVINFDVDKSEINSSEKSKLDETVNLAKKYPEYLIQIFGSADKRGDEKYNYQLSLKRSRSVADYFERSGIEKQRLVLFAKGESVTYDDSGQPTDFSLDRIVSFRFIEKK